MRYQNIDQKPYCCVGTCLEAILNRHNIPNNGQVSIACELGLVVPKEYAKLFPQAMIGQKPSAGYGTQIQKPEYSINNFFQRHKINLQETFIPINTISNIRQFLTEQSSNSDILICCHCGTLYNSSEADWGHMLLLENIDDDKVTLFDPSPKRSHEIVTLQRLIDAIKYHGIENGAGFYIISAV